MPSHALRALLPSLLLVLVAVVLASPALATDVSPRSLDSLFERYDRASGHKALAVTDGPRTAWALAAEHRTSDEAVKAAVALCQARAAEAGIDADCRVVAIDDRQSQPPTATSRPSRSAPGRR